MAFPAGITRFWITNEESCAINNTICGDEGEKSPSRVYETSL